MVVLLVFYMAMTIFIVQMCSKKPKKPIAKSRDVPPSGFGTTTMTGAGMETGVTGAVPSGASKMANPAEEKKEEEKKDSKETGEEKKKDSKETDEKKEEKKDEKKDEEKKEEKKEEEKE